MKRALKTGTIIFMVLGMLVSVVACNRRPIQDGDLDVGYKPNVSGEIVFTMNAPSDEERLSPDAFIMAFEKMYPDTKVNAQYSDGNRDARIASGDIGDVFHISEDQTYTYAITHRVLMPLDSYLEPLNIDVQQVYSGIYALGEVNGRLFMASRDHNHVVLMTNTDALAEAGLKAPENGWTWKEFKDTYAPALMDFKDDNTFGQVPMDIDLGYDPIYIPFLEGWGGTWFDLQKKKINLHSDPKVLQGITEMIEAAEAGYLKRYYASDTKAYAGLKETDYVFTGMVYPHLFTSGSLFDKHGVNWDISTMPLFPQPKVGTGSSGYVVYNRTKRPDTAAAFALFFFTEEGQKAFNSQTGGSVPLMKSLADDDFWRGKGTEWENKNYDAFVAFPEYDTVGQVQCRVPPLVAVEIDGDGGQYHPFKDMLRDHFDGVADFTDSLEAIEKKANEVWDKLVEDIYDF